ncbi:hypothetical protein AMK16_32660 [Streptomyces sp. CB00455]|nr:hypothetical protein AMK16_32660 [Streptomyces sp. CB00455]
MSTSFPALTQAVPPEVHAPEDDPVRVAWADEQFALYGASVSLWQKNLVRVVHRANGERPDLVEATDEGCTHTATVASTGLPTTSLVHRGAVASLGT